MGRRRRARPVGAVPRDRRTDVLAEQFDSMQRWVDFAAGAAATRPSPISCRTQSRPSCRTSSTCGTAAGTSANGSKPGTNMDDIFRRPPGRRTTARSPPRTCTDRPRSSPRSPHVLGRTTMRRRATASSPPMSRDAWRTEFIDDDGHVHPATQANLVRALAFDLVPDRSPSANRRRPRCARSAPPATTSRTGFLATPFLLPVLADAGHLDVAYELLFQDTEPSWLRHDRRGATTDLGGLGWRRARRHRVALAQPLQQGRGHLVPAPIRRRACSSVEPGYRRFRVAPQPGGGITWAETHHESPHGRIAVRWEQHSDRLDVVLDVPAGTTAEAVLPNGDTRTLGPGHHTLSS